MKLDISVIIPTMNRPATLERTIKGIFQWEDQPGEVLVIDQSADPAIRSQNQALLNGFPDRCRYYYLETPSSTASRNIGLRSATKSILVFMDDDVDVSQGTMDRITARMADPAIGMIALWDRQKKGERHKLLNKIFGKDSWHPRNEGYVSPCMMGRYPDKIRGEIPTQWAMGYCFAVRTQLVRDWGIEFDEQMTGYAYSEDLDFTFHYYRRAKDAGMKCILNEELYVDHMQSQEYRPPNKTNIYKYIINRTYLAYKHNMGFWWQAAILWTNFGYIITMVKHPDLMKTAFKAQLRCNRIRSRLKAGIIREEDTNP